MKTIKKIASMASAVGQWALMPEDGLPLPAAAPQSRLPAGKTVDTITNHELLAAVQLGYVSLGSFTPAQHERYEAAERAAYQTAHAMIRDLV